MPAATYQNTYTGTVRGPGAVSVSVTSAAVGDTLIVFQACDYASSLTSMVAPTSTTGFNGWTAVGAGANGADMYVKAWRTTVTTAGTRTVTMSRPTGPSTVANTVHVVRLSGVDTNQPIDGTPVVAQGSSGTSLSLGAITNTTTDATLVAMWAGLQFNGSLTITKPTAMTQRGSTNANDAQQSHIITATQALTAGGSTGTRVSTASTAPTAGWAGVMVSIAGVRFVPISAGTDTGLGSDEIVVDKTLVSNLTDPGLGTDTVAVFQDRTPESDGGVGSDSVFVDVLTPIDVSDSGVGSDSVEAAIFKGNDLGEQGTATDTVTVDQLFYITPTDQGTGSDEILLRQDKSPTDLGVGTDVPSSLRMPGLTDSGLGTDEVSVLDIPYTQVVRRDANAAATVYDLVVVARIPSATGAPSFLEVDPIEWKTLTYINTLGGAQELTATAQVSSITEPVLQRLRKPHELATELKLYRNGQVVFTGPLLGWQTSGETLTVKAGGLMAYLKLMVVTSDLTFTNIDQNLIVKALVDQWQDQAYGNFGIDTSSITASGMVRTIAYKKVELHNVATRIDDLSKHDLGFDAEVNPASRKLQLWSPKKGVDRSSGEDAIVFDDRNVTSSDIVCSVAIGDLASDAYGAGSASGSDEPFYAAASNSELRAKYGKSGVTESFSNLKTQGDVTGMTKALLNARGESLMVPGPKVRVTPDANIGAYDVGDTVAYDLGGTISVSGSFRIRKQSISATPTGQETVDLEFV